MSGPEVARLRVDPVTCEGIGRCAQVADDLIGLDRWGYPVVPEALGPGDRRAAARAVRACPRRALWIEEPDVGGRAPV